MNEPSAELLERYRTGDAQAAEELFARYVERLTAMVQWQIAPRLRRRLDPEDAVHSAYRSFFVKARQGDFVLQRSGDLWKLLVTITLNKLRRQIEHHRAGKRAVELDRPLDDGSRLAEGPSPLEALAAADELETFMAKLSPLQRRILEMRMQDRRWEEIAAATRCSERTARRTLEEVRRVWIRELPADADRQLLVEKKLRATIPGVREASPQGVDADDRAPLDYRDFVLNEHIGSGGMGKVYRARQKSLDRVVAVKMLRKARWTLPGAVERFLEEARVVARLHHPGIVGVHGFGRTPGGGVFIVIEFVEGSDLSKVMSPAGKPALRSAGFPAGVIADAAAALEHAHRQGIVHCDLKPSNLLIENTGRVVASDFGLATTLSAPAGARQWAGTWGYMAPEQLDATFGEIGPATDVFALGLVLHQLLTGRVVFQGKRILEVLSQPDRDWTAIWADTSIAPELHAVLARCLAIEPGARYSSAQELADALRKNTESRP